MYVSDGGYSLHGSSFFFFLFILLFPFALSFPGLSSPFSYYFIFFFFPFFDFVRCIQANLPIYQYRIVSYVMKPCCFPQYELRTKLSFFVIFTNKSVQQSHLIYQILKIGRKSQCVTMFFLLEIFYGFFGRIFPDNYVFFLDILKSRNHEDEHICCTKILKLIMLHRMC